MILIDERVGSVDLLPYFKPFGAHVEATGLEFGDACFAGKGPDGDVLVGVERKRVGDLVDSMRSNRLSGFQLPGMCRTYSYVYLIVEGVFRPGKNGELEEMYMGQFRGSRSRVMYREVDGYLATLEAKVGVIVRRSGGPNETATQIYSLYQWWQREWASHHSHDCLYAPTPVNRKVGFRYQEPTLVQKMAAQLPGIDRKALDVSKKFKTVRGMVHASERDWMDVKGVGKVLAKRMVEIFQ